MSVILTRIHLFLFIKADKHSLNSSMYSRFTNNYCMIFRKPCDFSMLKIFYSAHNDSQFILNI
uniref:Uncharacterized protein n=1 Tax=Heterorhabditis bacteriophora TaxID=37862 RepID=A0A1I7WLH2_HETBA